MKDKTPQRASTANSTPGFRAGTDDDETQILRLNQGALPHVNSLDEPAWRRLRAASDSLLVATFNDEVAGFLLAFVEGADYDSDNYQWFSRRYERFTYVDRIVVAPGARTSGIGRQLYNQLEQRARCHGDMLCCEVNVRPPNEASMAFHERSGFKEVGRQDIDAGSKSVALLVKVLS